MMKNKLISLDELGDKVDARCGAYAEVMEKKGIEAKNEAYVSEQARRLYHSAVRREGKIRIALDRKLSARWIVLHLFDEETATKLWWDMRLGFPMFKRGVVNRFTVGESFLSFDRDEALFVLSEMYRVLVPGGTATFVIPDLEYVAYTFGTKFYDHPFDATAFLFGRKRMRRAAYSFAMISDCLLRVGYTRIEKTVCPIKQLLKSRENVRVPLDRFGDFPSVMMTVSARRPSNDNEPSFETVEGVPPGILQKSLTRHSKRLKSFRSFVLK